MNGFTVKFKVSKSEFYKEGGNPFEEMKCIVIFEYDGLLDQDENKNYIFHSYKVEEYTFFELDSLVRQSMEVHEFIKSFIERNEIDFIQNEDIQEAVIHMVHGSGGSVSFFNSENK